MTKGQKTQARALARIPAIAAEIQNYHGVGVSIDGPAWVPDLADETGAVEGVLHRVLERLVGEPVEVVTFYGLTVTPQVAPMWGARQPNSGRWFNDGQRYPTRLEAIVAALLALEVTT